MSSVSPSLVEAAARAVEPFCLRPFFAKLAADAVLAAVEDALRLEGAQAERERIRGVIEAVRARYEPDGDGNRWLHDGEVLEAIGGVHPEASD